MGINKQKQTSEQYFKDNASELNATLGNDYSFVAIYRTKEGDIKCFGINPTAFETSLHTYEKLLEQNKLDLDKELNLEKEMMNAVILNTGEKLSNNSDKIDLERGFCISTLAGKRYMGLADRLWHVNQEILYAQMESLQIEPTYDVEDIQIELEDGN